MLQIIDNHNNKARLTFITKVQDPELIVKSLNLSYLKWLEKIEYIIVSISTENSPSVHHNVLPFPLKLLTCKS